MNKRSIVFLFFILISSFAAAQSRQALAADKAYESGYYTTAIAKYKKAYTKAKKNRTEKARISCRLGDCYCMTNRTKNAEAQYKGAIRYKYAERDSTVILKYAGTLRFNGKYELAKEQYQLYLERDPGNAVALAGLESCDMVMKWLSNSDGCIVEPIKRVNSKDDDFAPSWGDQSYTSIIFTSAREAATGKSTDEWTGQKFSDLFISSRDVKGKWSEPTLIDSDDIVNTTANEGSATTNYRGNRLYYTYCPDSKDEFTGCKIYVARRDGKNWSDPKLVNLGGDSTCVDGHPALSDDELTIVFASNRKGGIGGKDLYIATRASSGDDFDKPINLGNKVNTKADEMFPHFRNDTTLYFASNGLPGLGGFDIYYVYLDKNKIVKGTPVNVGAPINSSNDDFGIIFHPERVSGFFTSNRKGGGGGDDIYSFIVPPIEFTISGKITDETTLQLISGVVVKLTGTDGSTLQAITNYKGEYNFMASQIKAETTYDIHVEKDGYFNVAGKETTVGLTESHDFVRDFNISPIPEEPVVLPDILYDFAKWDLKPQYQDSLQGLIKTLDLNPTIIIELASHTDMIGSIESNDELSQKRAESVVAYLIDRGIDSKRLVAKGYGERRPRYLPKAVKLNGFTFPEGTLLTEDYINALPTQTAKDAANQLNRRSEFSIISKDFVPVTYNVKNESIENLKDFINIVVDPNLNYINYVVTKDNKTVSKCIANGYTVTFEYEPKMNVVYISQAKAIEFLKKGVITVNDFEGDATKLISQNNIADKAVINIKTIRFGSKQIENVKATVNKLLPYDMLLNKATLDRVGMVIIDKDNKMIIFE